jgi:hypothetical protein
MPKSGSLAAVSWRRDAKHIGGGNASGNGSRGNGLQPIAGWLTAAAGLALSSGENQRKINGGVANLGGLQRGGGETVRRNRQPKAWRRAYPRWRMAAWRGNPAATSGGNGIRHLRGAGRQTAVASEAAEAAARQRRRNIIGSKHRQWRRWPHLRGGSWRKP